MGSRGGAPPGAPAIMTDADGAPSRPANSDVVVSRASCLTRASCPHGPKRLPAMLPSAPTSDAAPGGAAAAAAAEAPPRSTSGRSRAARLCCRGSPWSFTRYVAGSLADLVSAACSFSAEKNARTPPCPKNRGGSVSPLARMTTTWCVPKAGTYRRSAFTSASGSGCTAYAVRSTLWASAGERAASGDGWKLPSSWRDPGLCGSQVRNRDRRWRSIDMRPPSTSPAAGRMDTPSRTNTVSQSLVSVTSKKSSPEVLPPAGLLPPLCCAALPLLYARPLRASNSGNLDELTAPESARTDRASRACRCLSCSARDGNDAPLCGC
mmetsp:Transcript_7978/g.23508  ORF Transcript_7978/g.23508 Transcript_7978/m.23508 type:complete len:322 (-) Transcript_7978:504-1469(-)